MQGRRTQIQNSLRAVCRQWQALLRLQDWDIRLYVVGKKRLKGSDGRITIYHQHKEAVVFIKDPKHIKPIYRERIDDRYLEGLVIHELLHIPFRMAAKEGPNEEERSINCLVTTLQRLARRAVG
jgi:hypothetical protein